MSLVFLGPAKQIKTYYNYIIIHTARNVSIDKAQKFIFGPESLLYAFGHNVSCQFCRRYGVYHINILQIRCSQLSRPRQINTTQYHSCSSMVKKCYASI